MQIKCTEAQRNALLDIRRTAPVKNGRRQRDRSQRSAQRAIFREIKKQAGLPARQKLAIFLDNPDNPLYLVLRDKRTKLPLDDGKAPPAPKVPVTSTEPVEVEDDFDFVKEFDALLAEALEKGSLASSLASTVKAGAEKLLKPAAKKAAVKAPAKKAAVKAVAKKVAVKAPAKKAAVKAVAKSPFKKAVAKKAVVKSPFKKAPVKAVAKKAAAKKAK